MIKWVGTFDIKYEFPKQRYTIHTLHIISYNFLCVYLFFLFLLNIKYAKLLFLFNFDISLSL